MWLQVWLLISWAGIADGDGWAQPLENMPTPQGMGGLGGCESGLSLSSSVTWNVGCLSGPPFSNCKTGQRQHWWKCCRDKINSYGRHGMLCVAVIAVIPGLVGTRAALPGPGPHTPSWTAAVGPKLGRVCYPSLQCLGTSSRMEAVYSLATVPKCFLSFCSCSGQ